MNSTSHKTHSPTTSDWYRIEKAVEAFEKAFGVTKVAEPWLFVPPAEDELYLPVAREILRVDLELAWSMGSNKRIEDYRSRFPLVFKDPLSLRALAFEEFRLRVQAGEDVVRAEYVARFGIGIDDYFSGEQSANVDPTSVFSPPMLRGFSPVELGQEIAVASSDTLPRSKKSDDFPDVDEEFLEFRLLRLIGRGAFARVFLAEQTEMAGRLVVLKISAELPRESQTLARLQHTNIVPIYSTHSRGRFTGICMPYFGSTTLADVLSHMHSQKVLPDSAQGILSTVAERRVTSTLINASDVRAIPREEIVGKEATENSTNPMDHLRHLTHVEAVLWIGAELAEGLAYSHDRGIVHRDIKPANVLIADDGRPMLLDFNLAVSLDQNRIETIGGTPSHMSPEQLNVLVGNDAVIDERSDIYSLGLVMYELLTGQLPTVCKARSFKERVMELQVARLHGPLPAASLNPAVTPAVDAILAKCMDPDPLNRYRTARALSEDIRYHLSDRPLIHIPEPSVRERLRKKFRRNPWLKSFPFIAAILLFAIGITTLSVVSAMRESERTDAWQRYQTFRTQSNLIRSRLSVPDPDLSKITQDAVEADRILLDSKILNDQGDFSLASYRRLDKSIQADIQTQAADLCVLLANAETVLAVSETELEARQSRMSQALRVNTLAEQSAPDLAKKWIVKRQRASLFELSNRREEAQSIQSSLGPPPSGPDATMYQFLDCFRRNELRQALRILTANDRDMTSRADYWNALGRTHLELGEKMEAVAAFTTALALQPTDSIRIRVHRGQAYLDLRNYAAACQDFDVTIRLEPEDGSHYVNRALARFQNQELRGALADLDRAIELDPGHTRSYFVRRKIHLKLQNSELAAKDLKLGIESTPEDEISWVTRGIHKLGLKDLEGGLADFDKALQVNPTSKRAMQNKASVLSENLNRVQDALPILTELIEIHPDYIPARAGRGVLLARLGKRKEAHADAIATLRRDSSSFTKYQVAGIYALTSQTHPEDQAEAFKLLAQSLKTGTDFRSLEADSDLMTIRNSPTFSALIRAAKTLDLTAEK